MDCIPHRADHIDDSGVWLVYFASPALMSASSFFARPTLFYFRLLSDMDFRDRYRQVWKDIAWEHEWVTVESKKKRRKYFGSFRRRAGAVCSAVTAIS